MLIAMHGMKLYGQCYTRIEAICSLLYMELSFMLIVIHELKLYAHCYAWSETLMFIAIHEFKLYAHCYKWCKALCSLLYIV